MAVNPENSSEDTPFNMAMIYYFRLNNLLQDKDNASRNGNLSLWYNCLRAIYRNIFFKIDMDKRLKLDAQFKNAINQIPYFNAGNERISNQITSMRNKKAEEILDAIDCELMVIMDQKKMIFPAIEIRQGLENLKKAYGIGGLTK